MPDSTTMRFGRVPGITLPVSRLVQESEPFLGAAEVGEIDAEHVEGTHLDARSADCTRHRQCLLARGPGALELPAELESLTEDGESLSALGRRRV